MACTSSRDGDFRTRVGVARVIIRAPSRHTAVRPATRGDAKHVDCAGDTSSLGGPNKTWARGSHQCERFSPFLAPVRATSATMSSVRMRGLKTLADAFRSATRSWARLSGWKRKKTRACIETCEHRHYDESLNHRRQAKVMGRRRTSSRLRYRSESAG